MKPVSFDYIHAEDLEQSLDLLQKDPDAELIAGGQTLVPLLNLRMARPSVLIDISEIEELKGITEVGDQLRIGAVTKQIEVEQSRLVAEHCPLLAKVMPWIGHRPTRARGTIGGSLATADPAAEIPLVSGVLEAEIEICMGSEFQRIRAADFFLGPLQTSLPEGACITALLLPIWKSENLGTGFREVSIRQSDFAIASAAVQIQCDNHRRITKIAIGVGAVGDYPQRITSVEKSLVGQIFNLANITEALNGVESEIEANGHMHASEGFSRRAAARLLYQVLEDICQELIV